MGEYRPSPCLDHQPVPIMNALIVPDCFFSFVWSHWFKRKEYKMAPTVIKVHSTNYVPLDVAREAGFWYTQCSFGMDLTLDIGNSRSLRSCNSPSWVYPHYRSYSRDSWGDVDLARQWLVLRSYTVQSGMKWPLEGHPHNHSGTSITVKMKICL